jgi:hypothetical protein
VTLPLSYSRLETAFSRRLFSYLPQRLKPRPIPTPAGTAEAMPFPRRSPAYVEILPRKRSGFQLRAAASLTPAERLNSGADDQD